MTADRVFVDSSFFKAVVDGKDEFHPQAVLILSELKKAKSELVASNFILDESYTLIRARCNLELAVKFREFLSKGLDLLRVERVTISDEIASWNWFLNPWKGLSFTDCTSFAVMKRLELSEVATFNNHFSKAGFKVLS